MAMATLSMDPSPFAAAAASYSNSSILFWEEPLNRFLADNNNSTAADNNNHEYHEEADAYGNYPATTLELILPRMAGILSLLAVVCVGLETWGDLRQNQHRRASHTNSNSRAATTSTIKANNTLAVTRIQCIYQVPLFLYSLVFAISTLPGPQNMGIWGALGNTSTCVSDVGRERVLICLFIVLATHTILAFNS